MVLLAWGVLTFGGVYPWAYWPLAIVSAALGSYAVGRTRAWRDARTRRLAFALAAIAAAIGLQVVALPYATVIRLSPAIERFFTDYAVAPDPVSLHTLSIAPDATLIVLLLFVALALLFLGLLSVLRFLSLEWLLSQIMGLGTALAVVAILQKALSDPRPGHELVYGFWKPQYGGNPFGPFINRNHFAGWMVMALPLVAGRACALLSLTRPAAVDGVGRTLRWLASEDASPMYATAASALVMATALVLSGSRSGMASFVIAAAVFGLLMRRDRALASSRWFVAAGIAVFLGGAVLWAGADRVVDRFAAVRNDASGSGRLLAWRDTFRIMSDFPWWGTGLGTYGRAMLVYQTSGRPVIYVQAHNDYLQLLAEGGVVVAVPVCVTAALMLLTVRRRLTSAADDVATRWVRAGAVAGLAGIAAQSAVDFSLQMPGNAVLCVLLLALALHRPRERPSVRPRHAAAGRHGYEHAHSV